MFQTIKRWVYKMIAFKSTGLSSSFAREINTKCLRADLSEGVKRLVLLNEVNQRIHEEYPLEWPIEGCLKLLPECVLRLKPNDSILKYTREYNDQFLFDVEINGVVVYENLHLLEYSKYPYTDTILLISPGKQVKLAVSLLKSRKMCDFDEKSGIRIIVKNTH